MSEIKAVSVLDGAPITPDMTADFLDVGTAEAPDIQLMRVFEEMTESPNMQTIKKHYTANKSATEIPVGFQTDITFTGDLYKNEKVMSWLRDIAEEQKLGVQADYYSVRLDQQIEGKTDVCYARKFRVSPVIGSIPKKGGEIMNLSGSFKPQGDVIIGEFDLAARKFTPKGAAEPEAPEAPVT